MATRKTLPKNPPLNLTPPRILQRPRRRPPLKCWPRRRRNPPPPPPIKWLSMTLLVRKRTSASPAGGKAKNVARSLVISSKVEGFRRAGRPWSRTAETINIEDFTEEQVMALLAEPLLDVVVVAE